MKRRLLTVAIGCMVLAAVLLIPMFADAQVSSVDPKEVTSTEAWDAFGAMLNSFQTVGVFAGLVALINFLLMLLRIPRLDRLLEEKGWKPYKVYIAAGLGGIGAMFSAVGAGNPWWPNALVALATGVLAGLTAVGVHQVKDAKKDSKLKAVAKTNGTV